MSTPDHNPSSNKPSSNKLLGFKNLSHKQRQIGLVVAVLVIGIILALAILGNGNKPGSNDAHDQQDNHADSGHSEDEKSQDTHEQVIRLSPLELSSQGIQLDAVALGSITSTIQLPARLVVNTDQQAHVSAGFSGLVQQVHVQVGQHVQQGQALASLLVPDLIDMQSNLKILQSQRTLANSNYQR